MRPGPVPLLKIGHSPPNGQLHRRSKAVRFKLMLDAQSFAPCLLASPYSTSAPTAVAEFGGVLDEGEGLAKIGRGIWGPRECPLDEWGPPPIERSLDPFRGYGLGHNCPVPEGIEHP